MRFVNPLPLVRDMRRALAFYRDVIGLTVLEDHGNFVRFETGFALHDGASLLERLGRAPPAPDSTYGQDNLVLYFEVEDLQAAFDRIAPQVTLLHPIRDDSPGHSVFRLYDPDRHIVEIGQAPPR
jgi:catechol 2,3-dioxygenase-like lactoylglutathione lyase family enzyme